MKTIILITLTLALSCVTESTYDEIIAYEKSLNKKYPQISTPYKTYYLGSNQTHDFFEVSNGIGSKNFKVLQKHTPLKLRILERSPVIKIDLNSSNGREFLKADKSGLNLTPNHAEDKFKLNDKILLDR